MTIAPYFHKLGECASRLERVALGAAENGQSRHKTAALDFDAGIVGVDAFVEGLDHLAVAYERSRRVHASQPFGACISTPPGVRTGSGR